MAEPTPAPLYASGAHRWLTQKGFELSGVTDKSVGVDRTVRDPIDQKPGWTTQIHAGDTISTILVDHANDPDLFAIDVKKQEEHGAIELTHTGLAPYESQRFVNMGLNSSAEDLKYLYLSWALHYLEDCGMPWHTTLDPFIQAALHYKMEGYIDANLSKWEEAVGAAPVKSVTNIHNSAWELAEFVNPYVIIMAEAWGKDPATGQYGDAPLHPDVLDTAIQTVLVETVGMVAGAIRNYNYLFDAQGAPPSIITAVVFGVPIVIMASAILGAKEKK